MSRRLVAQFTVLGEPVSKARARVTLRGTYTPQKTRDDIVGAKFIRTRYTWRTVRTVNAVTVSVETGYSWTDKVPFDRILEVRK